MFLIVPVYKFYGISLFWTVFTIQKLDQYPQLPVEEYIASQKGFKGEVGKVPDRLKQVVEGRYFTLRDHFQDFDM